MPKILRAESIPAVSTLNDPPLAGARLARFAVGLLLAFGALLASQGPVQAQTPLTPADWTALTVKPVDLDQIFRYRFVGEHRASRTGYSVSFSEDADCDGFSEVLIGAPSFLDWPGAAYLVSMADVDAADAADGMADRVIDLGLIAAQPRSWKLVGEGQHSVGDDVASGGDVNGDGCSDLLIGARAYGSYTGSAYVISAFDLPAADAADGQSDGVVEIRRIADRPDSWELTGEAERDNAGRTVIFAGDVNGDDRSDLLIGALFYGDDDHGAAYLLSGAALAAADAEDGVADGRIALASVAAQPDSWKFVGENAGDRAGARLAAANLDSDGWTDLVISAYGHTVGLDDQGAVYLVAAADLPAMDTADGRSDGLINLGHAASGRASWKLVGDTENQYIGLEVAAGDVDGDGLDDVVVVAERDVFVVSVSDLAAADAADGDEDGVVRLDRALAQENSFKLVGAADAWYNISSNVDIDGDGLKDILVGDANYLEGDYCHPGGGTSMNGAVSIIAGGSLHSADAADGVTDSIIDLNRRSSQHGFWKFIGAPTDRLGTGVSAGDVDGDGKDDLILASWVNHTPFGECGSTVDSGYVFLMSSAHLPAADTLDGETDGTIHLEALGVPTDATNAPVIFTQFDDNVIVVSAPDFLEPHGLDPDKLIKALLRDYGDVFDYLIVVTDLPAYSRQYGYAGRYYDHSNSVLGTGKSVFSSGNRVYGENLKGRIHLSYFNPSGFPGTLQHEIMHAWANFIIKAGLPHWGFSSANGVLGGFDMTNLVSLGNGRYTAGRFGQDSNDMPYSPIELYLAGLIPPEEVPDLWVAKHGAWSNENDASGNRVFTASDIETWSIQRIVETYGARTPSWIDSQKSFRAAAMLIVDDLAGSAGKARELSAALRKFSYPGADGDDSSYNFWEATGGRATLKTDDLRGVTEPESFSIPNLGGWSTTSSGTEETVRVGYGRISAHAGSTTPSGIAIFQYRDSQGVLIAEASVPATRLIQEGRIFAEVEGPVNTGLAIANPNDETAVISFYFTDTTGTNLGSGSFELGEHEQTARFLNQEPFNEALPDGSPVLGTFTFESSVPIAVIALRGFTNEAGEFLMTTLPVAPLSPASKETVYIPHFAAGGGWVTQVILVNPTDSMITGTVGFLGPGSGTAAASPVILTLDDGSTGSDFDYSIPPRSSQRFTTSNPFGALNSGSVRAVPDSGNAAPSGLVVFSYAPAGKTLSEAGVPALPKGSAFRSYAEASGMPGQVGSISTGLAITNVGDASNTVTLEVTHLNGSLAAAPETLTLPPSGQVARFLYDIFSLPDNFSGVLRVTSAADIAIVALRLRVNKNGEIKVTTLTPSNERDPSTSEERFFAHLADSGPWSTQFILFSGTAGQASTGTLSFIDTEGKPLDLTSQP